MKYIIAILISMPIVGIGILKAHHETERLKKYIINETRQHP